MRNLVPTYNNNNPGFFTPDSWLTSFINTNAVAGTTNNATVYTHGSSNGGNTMGTYTNLQSTSYTNITTPSGNPILFSNGVGLDASDTEKAASLVYTGDGLSQVAGYSGSYMYGVAEVPSTQYGYTLWYTMTPFAFRVGNQGQIQTRYSGWDARQIGSFATGYPPTATLPRVIWAWFMINNDSRGKNGGLMLWDTFNPTTGTYSANMYKHFAFKFIIS